ncbi:MAG TPA: ComF family protein [Trueperaceae bacterium]|nr:ComF family protein [Trueperaceae bacterium]
MEIFFKLSRCPVCKENASSALGACKTCQNSLFSPQIEDDLVYLGDYKARLEHAVKALKFKHSHRLSKLFANELAKTIKKANWQADIICPIPLHWSRYLERGYNQSALVAKDLAKNLDIEFNKLLIRQKKTKQQAKLNKQEREINLNNAFSLKNIDIRNKTIILLDDVITSGATINAAVSILEQAKAKIKIAAIAKTPLK